MLIKSLGREGNGLFKRQKKIIMKSKKSNSQLDKSKLPFVKTKQKKAMKRDMHSKSGMWRLNIFVMRQLEEISENYGTEQTP